MLTLAHFLTLGALLFVISVAGIFLNRKNVIILLMCIELMLLAVNMNFVAFSRFLGNLDGQVFVFFILTVAAAEAAIGLAGNRTRLKRYLVLSKLESLNNCFHINSLSERILATANHVVPVRERRNDQAIA